MQDGCRWAAAIVRSGTQANAALRAVSLSYGRHEKATGHETYVYHVLHSSCRPPQIHVTTLTEAAPEDSSLKAFP